MSYSEPNPNEKKVTALTRAFNALTIFTGVMSAYSLYVVSNMDHGNAFDLDKRVPAVVEQKMKQNPKLDRAKVESWATATANSEENGMKLLFGLLPVIGAGGMMLGHGLRNKALAKGPQ